MADIRLVDTHCHVDFHHFDDDREAVFGRYAAAGGQWLVAVAVDLENVPRLFALAEEKANVYCSVGMHPNHEVEVEPTVMQLCELAAHPKCVAIGETGMDFFRHHVDRDIQEARFRTHIRAAKRMRKPVIVHMREADTDTMRILEGEGVDACGGIMHCFSSTWEIAQQALELGMSISFSGNITFKRN
ncbi:MAG: TatD family hydrolase, partial [Mariprofundaceae bacterium]|nr:TatD family hydrolase [Mariprofundaceae bacterium]